MERKRLPAEGREILNALFAIGSLMDVYSEEFKRLCQRIPNGWRDFRMVQSKTETMIAKLLETIPVEQLKTIKHHMEMQSIHIGVKSAAQKPKDYWLMTYGDLADLAEYATKTTCFLCEKKGPCRLREILKEMPIAGVCNLVVSCWDGEK